MPASNPADMGERPACSQHIACTYLTLRGAHLVARARRLDWAGDVRPYADRRRRRRRRRFIPEVSDAVLEHGTA
jgi:hypothetical protein